MCQHMRLGVSTNPSNGARWQLDLGPTAARRNWLIAKRWLSSVRSCDYNAYFFTRLAPWLVGPWLSGVSPDEGFDPAPITSLEDRSDASGSPHAAPARPVLPIS